MKIVVYLRKRYGDCQNIEISRKLHLCILKLTNSNSKYWKKNGIKQCLKNYFRFKKIIQYKIIDKNVRLNLYRNRFPKRTLHSTDKCLQMVESRIYSKTLLSELILSKSPEWKTEIRWNYVRHIGHFSLTTGHHTSVGFPIQKGFVA